jgi:sigma-B regulation protein RsbU (phosphoserine phosphatase)
MHEFQPVAVVSGDFLDYFELPDGNIGLYLGDVSGKGLPAALYAALAVGMLRGVHKTGTSPSELLTTLNRRLLVRGVPRRHVATPYAVFDTGTHALGIASAGMAGPFHIATNGCHALELSGIPPGLFPVVTYDSLTMQRKPATPCFSLPTD